jgi:hypothetical protein
MASTNGDKGHGEKEAGGGDESGKGEKALWETKSALAQMKYLKENPARLSGACL